ncbi:MAG: ATP-dependent Clp protease proteolytic subunit [Planctomycetes bacterium]|nr:ATP-dependent Clp protease proteolytic subunit [Planctomycetota bacterium]
MERRQLRAAGQIWFLRLLVVVLGVLLATELRRPVPAAIDAEALGEIADDAIDQLVDVGAVGGAVDLDDPLLLRFRTIVLSGDIDARAARQAVSQLLYLDALEPGKPIDLYVRTQGGWGNDAHAICDAMQRIGSPVNTWALGSCDSAGAIVLAGGTGVRRAMPRTIVSIHVTEDEGDEPFSEELTERTREEAFWRDRAKLPARFYPLVGDRFYVLSAAEALEFGIIDEIHARPR